MELGVEATVGAFTAQAAAAVAALGLDLEAAEAAAAGAMLVVVTVHTALMDIGLGEDGWA